jgi:NADPH2:quinone reductase
MKAIIFKEQGNAKDVLSVEEANTPEIREGEVLIKVMARPINPSDQMFISGQYRVKPVLPQIAGLEGSGIITDLHETVNGFKAGDHVAFRGVGTWAEYITVKGSDLIAVNPDIPFETSCQIALNAVTAYALLELSKCKAGSYLLLSAGTSAVASLIIQIARARTIKAICLVRNDSQTKELLELGAFKVLKQDDSGLVDQVMAATDHLGIDTFLDAVGGPVLSNSIKTMRQNATIILYGRYATGPAELFNGDVIYRNLSINGFGIAQWLAGKSAEEKKAAFAYIFELINNKQLVLPQSHLYRLENITEALFCDESKISGKVILTN